MSQCWLICQFNEVIKHKESLVLSSLLSTILASCKGWFDPFIVIECHHYQLATHTFSETYRKPPIGFIGQIWVSQKHMALNNGGRKKKFCIDHLIRTNFKNPLVCQIKQKNPGNLYITCLPACSINSNSGCQI